MTWASLLNIPDSPLAMQQWSKANAIDHLNIIQGIARQSSAVTAITLESGGSGYTSAPAVEIAAPDLAGGTQATAIATFSNDTVTFTITNGGVGYSYAPAVTLSGGGGTGATASATVNYVVLTEYQLDPIPEFDIVTWENVHQQAHNDMLNALNLQNSNEEDLDFSSPLSLQEYIWQHFLDHQAVRNALAGSLASGS